MPGLRTILTIVQYATIMDSILKFNQEWEKKYNMHEIQVGKLIREGHSHYNDFLKFLMLVRTSCINGCGALNNMKIELEIAIEEEIFEQEILLEIKESSIQLSTIFESLHQQTKVMKKYILKFNDSLVYERKLIKNENCHYNSVHVFNAISSVAVITASLAGLMSDSMMSLTASAGSGAIGFSTVLSGMKNDKLQKQKSLSDVVEKMEIKVHPLFASVDKFSVNMHDVRVYIDVFSKDAKKLVSNESDAEHRVVIKAKGMIETINTLIIHLKEIETDSIQCLQKLREEIRVINPVSLIDL